MTDGSVTLRQGPLGCTVAPGCGGSIARFWIERRGGRTDLMRPAPDAPWPPREPLDTACFPLVPFSNRIAEGRCTYRGRKILLPLNAPLAHAIHGQAWLSAWEVEAADDGSATIAYRHAADAWPFAYRASQRFDITERDLTVTLELANEGTEPMPAGFGLHPYFPLTPETRLTARVDGVWLNDAAMLPSAHIPVPPEWDLGHGLSAAGATLDHGFTGWAGEALIEWPETGLRLRISADDVFGHLVVYVPQGSPWFCVEPVSHMTDAINRIAQDQAGTGLRELAPGEALTGRIRFTVEDAAGSQARP